MTQYHRAAVGRAWWRSLVELVLVGVLWFVASIILSRSRSRPPA